MTDQDENRPPSRREMRLREMAAAGLQTEAAQAPEVPSETLGDTAESVESTFEVDIPLLDENGNPRSRRELRELREQAIAELKAAADGESAEDPLSDLGFDPELAETAAFDVLAHDAEVEAAADAGADQAQIAESSEETAFDALLEQATMEDASRVEQVDLPVEEAPAPDEEPPSEAEAEVEPAIEVEEEPDAEQAAEVEPEAEAEEAPETATEPEAEAEAEPEAVIEPEPATHPADADDEGQEGEESLVAPVAAATGQAYSFPDITPLDDGQSIFDDPAIQVIGSASSQPGTGLDSGHDFDELITRAVAQEGAASTTNTSALILPAMPESDALTGPIGETGELFITGSFDLPKSLSETGGHASLHDSVDAEPFDELGFAEATPTGTMAPVSASRAVSARANQGPLVAEATKDKNKMPVVLIATGGVLVLGATGLIIWAATSGLFG